MKMFIQRDSSLRLLQANATGNGAPSNICETMKMVMHVTCIAFCFRCWIGVVLEEIISPRSSSLTAPLKVKAYNVSVLSEILGSLMVVSHPRLRNTNERESFCTTSSFSEQQQQVRDHILVALVAFPYNASDVKGAR
uniref:Uncharacterized protein n=1 Tax=Glossina austeni TaxID=7395 RepID=A0A1A9VGI9_GLOAU